jgi:phosphopantothenoylcysteine decarboxylase / phosphopantothenate---cysteine ligase
LKNRVLEEFNFKEKTILVGVCGGISAYKSVDLVSQIKKTGAKVFVSCTPNALRFVSKYSLEIISSNQVLTDQYESLSKSGIDHIDLARTADLILISSATANSISKLANGISDNILLDICLASQAPVLIAPAMNTNMWKHPIIQENVSKLKNLLSYKFIDPEEGDLACGTCGIGRLASLETILQEVHLCLQDRP